MRLFISILATASAALVAMSDVTLYARSNDSVLNDLPVSAYHEGAAINYLYLGGRSNDSVQEFRYDSDNKTLAALIAVGSGSGPYVLSENEDAAYQVEPGAENPVEVDIKDDGEVVLDGGRQLYAARDIGDPYNYSLGAYFLVARRTNGAVAITLFARVTNGTGNATNATNATTTTRGGADVTGLNYGVAGVLGVVMALVI
ncbi:Cell wall protein RHD3 [Candida viswanathii]|uniref:Cell wall protein RHD3 n=1 Tax=Candida viswanathii TaxID=5486 RepID=A0A367XZN5_9ASCO|nr:Cell wall protein RHD3 [Candida viswanathii]